MEACQHGLLMIAPIGLYGNVLRILAPLVITDEQVNEAFDVLELVLGEIV